MIPKDCSPWKNVYYYLIEWKKVALIKEHLDKLHSNVHAILSCQESLGVGIIDSRSIKASYHIDSDKGVD